MGWVTQQGTPSTTDILWPTRIPGRGSPTSDTDTTSGQTVSGLPTAILITDWLATTVGAKLELFKDQAQTLLQTIHLRFGEDEMPPYLPFRLELDDEGMAMPSIWSFRFKCSIGQFDAILYFREVA